jgi:glycosyltransferase involved in cell wall biosynthesis
MDNFINKYQKKEITEYPNNSSDNKPLVSVIVPTYQHVNYINQCLDGILMQKTGFNIEILLGEDASTDGTREVCINYADKYPDKIRLFLHHRENSIKINGMPTGRFNFMYNLLTARGKYIAICEGDDYWTDPLKLQKQVYVLERHPEYIACHHWHKYAIKDESGTYIEIPAPKNYGQGYFPKKIGTVSDIFANRLRIKSRTVMYRNIFSEIDFPPEWFMHVVFGDVPLSMILGEYGDFYFIDHPMAVYRQTKTGVSKAGPQDPTERYIQHYLNWIAIWDKGNKHHYYAYHTEARNTIFYFYRCIFKRKHVGLLFCMNLIKARITTSDILNQYRIVDAYRMAALLFKARISIKVTGTIQWCKRFVKKLFLRGAFREHRGNMPDST